MSIETNNRSDEKAWTRRRIMSAFLNIGGRYCAQGGPSPTPTPTATHTYTNSDVHTHGYSNSVPQTNSYVYTDPDCYLYPGADADASADDKTYTDSAAPPNSAAAPVTLCLRFFRALPREEGGLDGMIP